MITIKKDEYVFEVDVESTKTYYQTHSLCECDKCCYFYSQIKGMFPKLEEFLCEFGVDVSRPDEIFSAEAENSVEYINVDYTVCGYIKAMGQNEIDLHDKSFLSVIVTEGYTCPNEQTGSYFTLSVVGITLPGTPNKSQLNDGRDSRERESSFFNKIKRFFNINTKKR